jgi:thiamine-phosphate pyrophosphorylase
MRGYYFITDASLSAAGALEDVKRAVEAGVRLVQYRNKTASTRELVAGAQQVREICARAGVHFIVNDRLDVAMVVEADGIHIGRDDMPFPDARRLLGERKIIGLTVNSVEEALAAQEMGADYIAVAPIFPTSTKSDAGPACGVETLRSIRRICRPQLRIAAIGGIDLSNVRSVIEAGADMVCAISAVVSKPDVAGEIARFQREFGL